MNISDQKQSCTFELVNELITFENES